MRPIKHTKLFVKPTDESLGGRLEELSALQSEVRNFNPFSVLRNRHYPRKGPSRKHKRDEKGVFVSTQAEYYNVRHGTGFRQCLERRPSVPYQLPSFSPADRALEEVAEQLGYLEEEDLHTNLA